MSCPNLFNFLYLIASICFIYALRALNAPDSARKGNVVGMIGMALALFVAFCDARVTNYFMISFAIILGGAVGIVIAKKIPMTSLPQLMAGFHSFVGLAAVLVAIAAYFAPAVFGIGDFNSFYVSSLIEMSLGAAIGAITFTGSIVAFGKLQGILSSKPIIIPERHMINGLLGILILVMILMFCSTASPYVLFAIILASLVLGVLLIIPIGGADMPVVISMLNSYSGWAASGIGFTLNNMLLIITGALVGTSGAILSAIMCRAMNRSIFNVIFGGFGTKTSDKKDSNNESQNQNDDHGAKNEKSEKAIENIAQNQISDEKSSSESSLKKAGETAENVAKLLLNSKNIIIVPGYGMAVAHAQHAIKEIVTILQSKSIRVRFAIHPVAGRMPGHMNVLLAEANIDYDDICELEDINEDFKDTDVALVIGANDVTNPLAKTDPSSPIYGMPILDVEDAKNVVFIKRSLSAGYAGTDNPLFYMDKTKMLYGDAKKVCESIVQELEKIQNN